MCSKLSKDEVQKINNAIESMSEEGFRVLGVGVSEFVGKTFPKTQQEFTFNFLGVVAFYDPPKENIKKVESSKQKLRIAI